MLYILIECPECEALEENCLKCKGVGVIPAPVGTPNVRVIGNAAYATEADVARAIAPRGPLSIPVWND